MMTIERINARNLVFPDKNTEHRPILFMMVGLPGSGKSTFAHEMTVVRTSGKTKPVVHSPDVLRKELFGDEADQSHDNKVSQELHRRIGEDLLNNNDVIYDATNISKKRRRAFLKSFSAIECYKVCVCMLLPYADCVLRNASRDKAVSETVIRDMYLDWNPPSYDEGFDHILLNYCNQHDAFTLYNFFAGKIGADYIEQDNTHHTQTIGKHCKSVCSYLADHYPDDTLLHLAGLMHDIGKVFTKSPLNYKGENDGQCHYYQHHCVGAYDSLFYTDNLGLNSCDKLVIANLIYYHMMPAISWDRSEKAMRRSRLQIGDEMFERIMRLHEADLAAR